MARLGTVYTPDRPPEEIAAFARLAETTGLDELWLWDPSRTCAALSSAFAPVKVLSLRFPVGRFELLADRG